MDAFAPDNVQVCTATAAVQAATVTDPFDAARPPPIVPRAITILELDNILAFVAAIEPADLGAPLKHQ